MQSILNFLEKMLVWFKDLLLWIPRKLVELVLDGLASLFELIPVPDFFSDASGYLSSLDSELMYFMAAFRFDDGLTIVMSAFILRFLIRRLPVIG